ncbi:MAG: transposase, partial [Solirubrobacteraceae bacterium]
AGRCRVRCTGTARGRASSIGPDCVGANRMNRRAGVFVRNAMSALAHRLIAFENVVHRLLVRHSISALRSSVGAVFLGFGVLKYFPGVSPAEDLVVDATGVLFLGLIAPGAGLAVVATMECFIGICFLTGSGALMRVAIWVLAAQFVGILSPLVIDPARLFAGPYNAPTLEGQYVLKDLIIVAAGMVIAAGTFRGGRMVRDEPQIDPANDREAIGVERKLEVVLSASSGRRSVEDVCRQQGVSEAVFYEWRDGARR